MASVLRTGLANLNPTGLLIGLCKGTSKCRNVALTQVATISSREVRQDRPPRPPPFDWKHKDYTWYHWITDPMMERLDDNSKVVIVEGMPAVGKDKFAKELAERLDMVYIPPPTFDTLWVDPRGFDHRSLNSKLPIDSQFFDLESWLKDPAGRNTAAMQVMMLYLRCNQYIDALVEVLSTGNGVVLQRCPWTDATFMQAMLKSDYVSRLAHDFYKAAAIGTLQEIIRPHLIVYLDAPVSVIKDNIKKRNIPYEVNSKALTDKYLHDLEHLYKTEYLREMSKHGHLLIYDWAREGDVGVVVEDIERLDFDNVPEGSEKFRDWKYDYAEDLKQKRWDFHMDKFLILTNINVARFDIPEMLRSAEDAAALEHALDKVPQVDYAPGFNPKFDKGVLWKLHDTWEDWYPNKAENKAKKQQ